MTNAWKFSSRRWIGFWLPVLIGAVIRVYVVANNTHVIIWDEGMFHDLATRLSQGESYGIPFWPPAWPTLLSFLYRIFGAADPKLGLWFNCVSSIATLIVFQQLAQRLFSNWVAAIAAWLMALMPSYIVANNLLIYEVWMQLLLVVLVYLAIHPNWSPLNIVGMIVVCSLLTLLKPTWLLLPIVIGLTHKVLNRKLPIRKPTIRQLLVFQVGVVALIAPWVIYASWVSGRFVPIALQGGLHLWLANNPNATGTHVDTPLAYFDPQNANLAQNAAIEFIREHPLHLITILPAKLWYMFRAEAWSSWVFTKTEPAVAAQFAYGVTVAGDVYYYLILGLAIAGIIIIARNRQYPNMALLVLFAYGVSAQIAIFTGQLKYRWPMQFVLILYAAYTLSVISQKESRFVSKLIGSLYI